MLSVSLMKGYLSLNEVLELQNSELCVLVIQPEQHQNEEKRERAVTWLRACKNEVKAKLIKKLTPNSQEQDVREYEIVLRLPNKTVDKRCMQQQTQKMRKAQTTYFRPYGHS